MFNRKQIVAMEKCNSNRFICNSNRLLCLQDVIVIEIERKQSNRLHYNVIDPRPDTHTTKQSSRQNLALVDSMQILNLINDHYLLCFCSSARTCACFAFWYTSRQHLEQKPCHDGLP